MGVSTVIPNTILFVDSRERNRKFVDFGLARGVKSVERESRESRVYTRWKSTVRGNNKPSLPFGDNLESAVYAADRFGIAS